MAELEQGLEELKVVKQAFKDNFESDDISTTGVEFRNMPNLMKQMEKKLPTQTKTVTPTTSEQNISADTGYKLTEVKVEAVTSAIDPNIQEYNIRDGVTVLGKTGTLKNDLVDVDELPTTDIDDSKIYRVNSYVGAYYMMYFGALTPLTNYFQYREIRVMSIDDVTDPEITTGADDMVIYTDTSTYIGYVFMDAESPTSLGVFFGESDDFNKGYIDDTSNITESGIYYTQTVTSKIGVPNKNNEEILEYWLNEKWTQYLRLTRDMIVGVWKYDNGDYVEYLELKADGTASLKGEDGIIQKDGTFSIGSGSYFTNLIIVTFSEDDVLQFNYVVTEDAVKLGININDGQEYYVKQSEYVVAEVSGQDNKFIETVNGTLTTITAQDLKDATTIRNYAFQNMSSLVSVEIPSHIGVIGQNAFNGCSNLTSVVIPEGVRNIGANAFFGTAITDIQIPSTVYFIGNMAFAYNTAITTVTIPTNITNLNTGLFQGCTNLTEVTVLSKTPPAVTDTTFPDNVTAIYVPYGSYDSYVANWTTYADKIVRLPAVPGTLAIHVENYLVGSLPNVTLTITGNGQTYTGITDTFGNFELTDLMPVVYSITASDIEGLETPETTYIVVEEGSRTNVTITYIKQSNFGTATEQELLTIANDIHNKNMTSMEVYNTYGWKLGDVRLIPLSTGEIVPAYIIGFNHDILSDGNGTAGVTIQTKNCLATLFPMNDTYDGTVGGYPTTTMKLTTLPTIKSTLPQGIQNIIAKVDKKSANGGKTSFTETITSSEELFLLSEIELYGTIKYAQAGANEGSVYEYWNGKANTDRIKYYDEDGDGNPEKSTTWRLRSCSNMLENIYCCVSGANGSPNTYTGTLNSVGLSFAFCIGDGTTGGNTPTFSRTFSENTPEQISAVSEQISANNMTSAEVEETYGWKLGDTKDITLTTGEVIQMRIIGFNHDALSDGNGTAGVTLEMTNVLATGYRMTTSSKRTAQYSKSEMVSTTLPKIKATLPQEWQDIIKIVDKQSNNSIINTNLFLLSEYEVRGTLDYGKVQEGTQYEYYMGKTNEALVKQQDSDGDGVLDRAWYWWLRTKGKDSSGETFSAVHVYGSATQFSSDTEVIGVSFAFCI